MDFVIIKDGELIWSECPEYHTAGRIWKRLGGRWGGDFSFKDFGHFEA
jgi:hypothetical protein